MRINSLSTHVEESKMEVDALSDHAGLLKYRKVIATIRDRVRSQKRSGKTLAQVQAAKPSAQFDAEWGKGMLPPNDFVAWCAS